MRYYTFRCSLCGEIGQLGTRLTPRQANKNLACCSSGIYKPLKSVDSFGETEQ